MNSRMRELEIKEHSLGHKLCYHCQDVKVDKEMMCDKCRSSHEIEIKKVLRGR